MDCHKEQLSAQLAYEIVRKSRKQKDKIDNDHRITSAYKCVECGHYHTTSRRYNVRRKKQLKWIENKKTKSITTELRKLANMQEYLF